jgi:transcriptional regulator with XRE-family HTH domain
LSSDGITFAGWLDLQFAQTPNVFARDIAATAKISPGYLSGLRKRRKENPSALVAEEIAAAFAARRGLDADSEAKLKHEARQAATTSSSWRRLEAAEEKEAPDAGRWATLGDAFGRRSR